MATAPITTTAFAHTSDATFRAWGLESSTTFSSISGFPVTTDTGQINWTTVTRPGGNTSAGYEIRKLDDALDATFPLRAKVEYGTGNNTYRPQIWITVGTGSNGSGTITGVLIARVAILAGADTAVGTFPSYFCALPGYVGFAFKRRGMGSNTGAGLFLIMRTTDTSGAITGAGVHFYYTVGDQLKRRSHMLSLGVEIDDGSSFAMLPGGNTTTLAGGSVQIMRHFGMQPTNSVVPFCFSYLDAEIGSETNEPFTPIGVTSRNYLTLGGTGAPTHCSANNIATHRLAMQYE